MNEKKEYIAPEMKVVELDNSTDLLSDSMDVEFIERNQMKELMEKRKEYAEPEMKIVQLASQMNLLEDSCEGDDCTHGPFGLAPHDQDPLA